MSRENPTKGNIRYLSLFSGIEACTVAWKPLGWEAVAFAQYEPGDNIQFPSQVLKYHYPDVPNLGDVTKITEEQIAALGHIDLVVGGSPCQSLSIAGKRHGLRHADGTLTRSGLFDYQMEIYEWAVKNNGCRFMLWENVPGAFSSNNGNDFGYILGSMVQGDVSVPKDGWDSSGVCISESGDRCVEWTVLNAAEYGVPQRRNRVFALCDTGAWWSRPPILFESEGLQMDSEEDDFKAEEAASDAPGCSSDSGSLGLMDDKAVCFSTGKFTGIGFDVAPTITRRDFKQPNCVGFMDDVAIGVETQRPNAGIGINVMPTLACSGWSRDAFVAAPDRELEEGNFPVMENAQHCDKILNDLSPTILARAGTGGNTVPMVLDEVDDESRKIWIDRHANFGTDGLAPTLCAKDGTGGNNMPMVLEPTKENSTEAHGVCYEEDD